MNDNEKRLFEIDLALAADGYLQLSEVVDELRLLADSMSTHKALAEKIGISEQYLCDILKGHRRPGKEVCKFLKLEPVLVYREAAK